MSRIVRSLGRRSSAYPFAFRAARTSAAERVGIPLRLQGGTHFGRREVGVPAWRPQFGVGVGVGLDDATDVGGQFRVLLLAPLASPRGEVLPAAEPAPQFMQPRRDRVAS